MGMGQMVDRSHMYTYAYIYTYLIPRLEPVGRRLLASADGFDHARVLEAGNEGPCGVWASINND